MVYLYHINTLTYHELKDQLTIGRTTGDIVCNKDGRLSGKHAQVSFELVDNKRLVYLEDLGSKNRTICNRAEIVPNQKIQIGLNAFLEIGDQQFLVTEFQDLAFNIINELVELQTKKKITTLESKDENGVTLPEIKLGPKADGILEKEAEFHKLAYQINEIEQDAKRQLQLIEAEKQKIITEAKAKKTELSKIAMVLKTEIEKDKQEVQRLKNELEIKKKKIINIKDIKED